MVVGIEISIEGAMLRNCNRRPGMPFSRNDKTRTPGLFAKEQELCCLTRGRSTERVTTAHEHFGQVGRSIDRVSLLPLRKLYERTCIGKLRDIEPA